MAYGSSRKYEVGPLGGRKNSGIATRPGKDIWFLSTGNQSCDKMWIQINLSYDLVREESNYMAKVFVNIH